MSNDNPLVATYDEHADYGVAYSRTFTHLDDEGAPIDNTGKTAAVSVRQDYSTAPIWSTAASTITTVMGGTDGTVTVSISETHMKDITSAQYSEWQGVYDVVLESSGEAYLKLVAGDFTVHPTSSET